MKLSVLIMLYALCGTQAQNNEQVSLSCYRLHELVQQATNGACGMRKNQPVCSTASVDSTQLQELLLSRDIKLLQFACDQERKNYA